MLIICFIVVEYHAIYLRCVFLLLKSAVRSYLKAFQRTHSFAVRRLGSLLWKTFCEVVREVR